ncbi:MAG: hypothetical protein MJ214_04085 [Bacilli bacterium]|nr:hypothetical protein [Bacilli bacterium]
MFKKITKLSLLPLVFALTSCTVSPQQAFQNAKLTLVNEIKVHYKVETLTNINYGEMQYILLNETGDKETFPVNRYYYYGEITITASDEKAPRRIYPTTYYDLTSKQGKILETSATPFKKLKELVDAGGEYSGSQGTFFPSNY